MLFFTFPVLVWLVDGAAAGRLGGAAERGDRRLVVRLRLFPRRALLGRLRLPGRRQDLRLAAAVRGRSALPAGMACFTALRPGARARCSGRAGRRALLALAVALTVAEWLRGHLFTGFPWNTYGYALTGPLVLAQSAALIGIWGLTFIAVAVFASPAVLADDRADTRRPWLPLALGVVLLAALAGYGAMRLARTPTAFVDGVRLRIMQPNLQQDEKFNYAAKQQVMSRYLALSDRSTGPQSTGVRDVTHLIWPESAFPFFLTREPDALAQIAALLPEGTVLITGAVRAPEPRAGRRRSTRAYNSIYVIDHDGSILSVYDKVHLVPFGEYLPFQDFLERLGLMQLTKVPGGFIAGDRRRADGGAARAALPAADLLRDHLSRARRCRAASGRAGCSISPTTAGSASAAGPISICSRRACARSRKDLPLVRAANTGISAVIDPLGRIIKSLPLGTEGVLDAPLPRRIDRTALCAHRRRRRRRCCSALP